MFKFNQTLMNFVRRDLDMNLIPMLLGEPGIGKSSWLIALSKLMHTECFVLACNQLADKADLTGARLVPCGNDQYKQVFYPHAVIHDAIEYAIAHPRETPILFMDELNRTTPDVTSEALSIPTLRAIGSTSLPANLRVVIAGNDKGNVTSLDEASVSRFVLYHVGPDTQTFLSLDPELNVFVRNVLSAHPECIFGKSIPVVASSQSSSNNGNGHDDDDDVNIEDILDDGESMNQITTPRTISGISRWLNTFKNDELIQALADTHVEDGVEVSALQEGIEGHVGRTNFSVFLLNEIAGNVTNVNSQSAAVIVGIPQCYNEMKASPDMTALNAFIAGMSDNDKSGAMLYMLYEKVNNTNFIQALAPAIGRLEPNDARLLTQLAASNQLDEENVQALTATGTPIANSLSTIMNMF